MPFCSNPENVSKWRYKMNKIKWPLACVQQTIRRFFQLRNFFFGGCNFPDLDIDINKLDKPNSGPYGLPGPSSETSRTFD